MPTQNRRFPCSVGIGDGKCIPNGGGPTLAQQPPSFYSGWDADVYSK